MGAGRSCYEYVRLEASPLALGPTNGGTSSTDVSSNGIVYRYGTMQPQSRVFVKAGFNDIHNCSVAIYARRNDTELATVKYVTSDEYIKYSTSLIAPLFAQIVPILCHI